MLGLMMEKTLLAGSLLQHAERLHAEQQVVSRLSNGVVAYHQSVSISNRMKLPVPQTVGLQ